MPITMSAEQYARGECTVDGEVVSLTHRKIPWASVNAYGRPKVEILRMLIEAKGEFVARDDLIGKLWPNPDEEPEWMRTAIGVQIHKLRKLLGPERIEVRYRQGWRIVQ